MNLCLSQPNLATLQPGNVAADDVSLQGFKRAVQSDQRFASVDLLQYQQHLGIVRSGYLLDGFEVHDWGVGTQVVEANAVSDRLPDFGVTGQEYV